jgi:hypothetical protein
VPLLVLCWFANPVLYPCAARRAAQTAEISNSSPTVSDPPRENFSRTRGILQSESTKSRNDGQSDAGIRYLGLNNESRTQAKLRFCEPSFPVYFPRMYDGFETSMFCWA